MEWAAHAERAALDVVLGGLSFGFTPQTEAYTNCMMNLDEEDKRQKQRAEQCKAMSQLVTASTAAYNLCMAMTN